MKKRVIQGIILLLIGIYLFQYKSYNDDKVIGDTPISAVKKYNKYTETDELKEIIFSFEHNENALVGYISKTDDLYLCSVRKKGNGYILKEEMLTSIIDSEAFLNYITLTDKDKYVITFIDNNRKVEIDGKLMHTKTVKKKIDGEIKKFQICYLKVDDFEDIYYVAP